MCHQTVFGVKLVLLLLPFYGHYTGQPALDGTPVKNWRILLVQSFTSRKPLLTATSAFELGRRCQSLPQQCYLHFLHAIVFRVKNSHKVSESVRVQVWAQR